MKKMFAALLPAKKDQRGFTLMELLICIVILGLLIAATATAYNKLIGDASPRTAAMAIAKDMKEVYQTSQKSYVDHSTEISALTDLTSGGYLMTLPTSPNQAVTATTPYVFDNASYTGWGSTAADSVVSLTNVTKDTCSKIQEVFNAGAAGADPPAAIDYTKQFQCFGAGPYTAVQPIYVH